ncbi:MAG: hypothetical protein ACFNP5_07730, partial [Hoylesella saccharolytica]
MVLKPAANSHSTNRQKKSSKNDITAEDANSETLRRSIMSIRFKLTLFMIITVLVTASLSLTFMVLSVRRKFEQRFYEDSEGMLNSAAINLKTDFTKGFSAAQYWSENHNLISWVEQGQPEGTLKA